MTNPLLREAISSGASLPILEMSSLKSSTAFQNHIKRTRKDVMPIKKPSKPIHAVALWTPGRSKCAPIRPSVPRWAVKVYMNRKITVKASETAMKAGVVEVGAVKRSGALDGSTERLYVGDTVGTVHVTLASLFGREHEPRAPRNTFGPSTDAEEEFVKAVDGETTSRATWVDSIKVGERYENSMSRNAVRASRGASRVVIALENPAIMVTNVE